MTVSRDQLLALADNRDIREVDVPGLGVVRLAAMSLRDFDSYQASQMEFRGDTAVPNLANTTAKLLVRCIVDDQGERMFADHEVGALAQIPAGALSVLVDAARAMHGLTAEAAAEIEGNSDADPSVD